MIHCPGHTADSICLYSPADHTLYSADTVLGQGTAVFEDLASYITSLRKLLTLGSDQGREFAQLYPGHGPVITRVHEQIEMYIRHRLEREEQIVQVLRDKGAATVMALVAVIYAAYPTSLWTAAAHGVVLHLNKLEGEGRAKCIGGNGHESEWQLTE